MTRSSAGEPPVRVIASLASRKQSDDHNFSLEHDCEDDRPPFYVVYEGYQEKAAKGQAQMEIGNGPSYVVRAAAVATGLCVLAASRFLPAPKHLYYFDSVNFALALVEEFNPALHQPQPPGYPLFVALTRVLHLIIGPPQDVFVIAGIIGSAIALLLVWRLGREMFGETAGACAALLLLFHPPFWFGGLTNQVRVFLAVGSAAVMLAAWRSLHDARPHWFYATAALLGVLSGFRPSLLVFLAALLAWCGLRPKRSVRQWAIAGALLVASACTWLYIVLVKVGGPIAYLQILWDYSEAQFSATSLAFGSDTAPAMRMLRMAMVWYGLPILSWIWVLPFTWRRLSELKPAAAFLIASFLPGFLFHTFIHVGDPDQTLVGAPALCLAGGFVLSRLEGIRTVTVTMAAVALNVLLFFAPPKGIARACSYGAVHEIDHVTRQTLHAIEELRKASPVLLVTYDHLVTWRHLYFYFPENTMLLLRDNPRGGQGSDAVWLFRNRKLKMPEVVNGEIVLPANAKVVWLLSRGRGMHRLLEKEVPFKWHETLAYVETKPGLRFRFGAYRFYARAGR